jgi:hypothetical protein
MDKGIMLLGTTSEQGFSLFVPLATYFKYADDYLAMFG